MFIPLQSPLSLSFPEHVATSAALKCLLAYTYGLEDCRIDAEVSDGGIVLTGNAPCPAAAKMATKIAAEFTSKPVRSLIHVTRPALSDPALYPTFG